MFTRAEVEKLRNIQAPEPIVLSLYLRVPLDPGELRGLTAEAGDLMADIGADSQDGISRVQVSRADRDAVFDALAAHGRDWLGHTVAFFSCAQLDLFEVLPLPCAVPERGLLAIRPHVRPLLTALQRSPDYRVAIVDRRHSWVLAVSGTRVETLARSFDEGLRSTGFGGWYGLEARRVQQRVIQLSHRHYRDVAAALERAAVVNPDIPLVIGGHHESIAHLLQVLPPAARNAFAGSLTSDTHSLTAAEIRELAQPVIEDWVRRTEQKLTSEIIADAPRRLTAVGLPRTLAAAGQHAVAHLLVAHADLIPGFVCGRCGVLTTGRDDCPDWGTAACAVPDLLEELAQRTLDDDGKVTTTRDTPFTVAARLRFPVSVAS
jgi:peptide chain release factor subunit 1